MDGEQVLDLREGGDGRKVKPLVVLLVGAPGSGKSTFCENVMRASQRPWVRICQDNIANGNPGTKAQCIKLAKEALARGKSVFIDRCNIDKSQRSDFINQLGGQESELHAVILNLPARVCISRSVKRIGHEGDLQGGRAAAVVNRMLKNQQLPEANEGFPRITYCQNDADVADLVNAYRCLKPGDSLPHGCFGRKNPNSNVQTGIMRYLKKIEKPKEELRNSTPKQEKGSKKSSSNHTLAFPSISTSDFQFDLEKASDIIVDCVVDFLLRHDDVRLLLVDLFPTSKILSLVKSKAAGRNIDPERFSTFIGDITRLFSQGGLRCAAIANPTNWRLKPGGGVNAAVFEAAGGAAFEAATKEKAETLIPGTSVVVTVPHASPLLQREGVSHVIHVLGPNMNPNRPDCLGGDYEKGSRILRAAYFSLFESFISIIENHGNELESKRKKQKEECKGKRRTWASWAQALHRIIMEPDKHPSVVMEISDDFIVLADLYPKAKKHVLILSREENLDSLADADREHIQLLRKMHEAGMKWAEKFLEEDPSLIFRLGYHSEPSMQQLHLHVISQDFDSEHMKNKKHWNSFTTAFFRDSVDVLAEVENDGVASLSDEKLLTAELRCHRCRSAHPNMPKLKAHVACCQVAFPEHLLRQGRLVALPSFSISAS